VISDDVYFTIRIEFLGWLQRRSPGNWSGKFVSKLKCFAKTEHKFSRDFQGDLKKLTSPTARRAIGILYISCRRGFIDCYRTAPNIYRQYNFYDNSNWHL